MCLIDSETGMQGKSAEALHALTGGHEIVLTQNLLPIWLHDPPPRGVAGERVLRTHPLDAWQSGLLENARVSAAIEWGEDPSFPFYPWAGYGAARKCGDRSGYDHDEREKASVVLVPSCDDARLQGGPIALKGSDVWNPEKVDPVCTFAEQALAW